MYKAQAKHKDKEEEWKDVQFGGMNYHAPKDQIAVMVLQMEHHFPNVEYRVVEAT